MAADPKISYTAANAMMDALSTALDAGKLRIYDATGGVPSNADDSIGSNVLLAELTLNAASFGTPSNGAITAGAITADSSANATGTASHFRLWDAAGTTCYFQGTCGTSAADLVLNSLSIASGATVSVSSLVLTLARE
jgi:hypothetical protein